ncbi:hypothetical protein JRO89_XS13G0035300 [Xanthoceras sorbifolium]|uniref:Uncharacterized protein n=1 Tax=Xanthoceras sorbifolium TaxID=99658 RepID=A0ABQ8H6D4_9ROSI|nr:hypothetical protein JRO89_XS13G0035300 [Xanthoceras sorbifolium]
MSSSSVTAGGDCGSKAESSTRLKELYSFENDPVPKVRKPYTITKQREKWTEEEHQRFLEALKLYGRGWRQIEEHVGTKTAVQIRSHAQKFFSKVVRESNGSIESSIKTVEIPPPRPKRKPVHPYPRKSVDSLKGSSGSIQPERTPSPNALVLDNQSPTSVLSAFASDTLASGVSDQQNQCSSPSGVSDQQNQCSSPTSCTTDNEYATSNSSPEEEKPSVLPTQLSASSTEEDLLSAKFEPQSEDSVCVQGEATMVQPCMSIKLFGRTVLVTDSQKPHSPGVESYKSPISKNSQVDLETDNENFVEKLPSKQLDIHLSLGMVSSNWNTSPSEAPRFADMNLPNVETDTAEACSSASLPLLRLHQGLPLVYTVSNNQTSAVTLIESSVNERLKEKDILNDRSCTGSSTGSVSELETRERNSDTAVDSQCRQSFSSARINSSKSAKGFVPYKRCLAEGEMKSSMVVSEERERQRARVC